MSKKNYIVDSGITTFTFSDADGEMIASVKLNLMDPRILNRCKNLSEFFLELSEKTALPPDEYEALVEDKFCEFVGYDCRASLFRCIAATATMKDGRPFLAHVLDALIANVGPEIRRLRAKNLARYTAKYKK